MAQGKGKKNKRIKRLKYSYEIRNYATWRGRRLQDEW